MKKLVALAMLATITAVKVDAAAIALGTQEIRASGGIDFESATGTDIRLDLGYGYFIADYLEVGGLFGIEDNDRATSLRLGGFAEYNIETETNVIPFFGGQLRYIYADFDTGGSDSAIAFGGYGGAKFFITENLALTARLLIEFATEEIYIEEDKVNDTDIVIDLGLNYYF